MSLDFGVAIKLIWEKNHNQTINVVYALSNDSDLFGNLMISVGAVKWWKYVSPATQRAPSEDSYHTMRMAGRSKSSLCAHATYIGYITGRFIMEGDLSKKSMHIKDSVLHANYIDTMVN